MSAPVEVLAVMATGADVLSWHASGMSRRDSAAANLLEARAAVAELIKAAGPMTNALDDSGLRSDIVSGMRAHEAESLLEQMRLLRATLARCGAAQ